MNRLNGVFISAVMALAALVTGGCDDLLVVDPTESVPPSVVTKDVNALQAVLAGAYRRLQGGGFGSGSEVYWSQMTIYPDVLADNGDEPAAAAYKPLRSVLVNEIGTHFGQWTQRYLAINSANVVIKYAPEVPKASESKRSSLEGEALFLRALHYHDLARVFSYEPDHIVNGWNASVVLRTEPTEGLSDAEPKARATVPEVYQQIETDLKRSIQLLSSSGGSNVYFATQAAAEALLGRVYLYASQWNDAITYSSAALQHTSAHLATAAEYPGMFSLQPNPESLFEIAITEPDLMYNNYCMACYFMPKYYFTITPTAELMASYEPGDVRLQIYGNENGTPWVQGKWTEAGPAQYMDNVPLIRYSEVLLNRAEAYAESGKEDLARADVNTLRASRNLGPITASGSALIDAIMKERRTELAFEGFRWFDLKRRGMDIPKPASLRLPAIDYTDFRILAPVPNTEVQSNELLKQNPGY